MTTLTNATRKTSTDRIDTITGIIKPSGQICGHVINDTGKHYFTTINTDGTTSCHFYNKKTGKREECLGHHHRGHCRHTDKTQQHVGEFKSCDELTAPDPNDEPLPPAARLAFHTLKTPTPHQHMLLPLQDNRSVTDKIYRSLARYR